MKLVTVSEQEVKVSVEPSSLHDDVVDVVFTSVHGKFRIIGFTPDGRFFRYTSEVEEDTEDSEKMGLIMDLEGRIEELPEPL